MTWLYELKYAFERTQPSCTANAVRLTHADAHQLLDDLKSVTGGYNTCCCCGELLSATVIGLRIADIHAKQSEAFRETTPAKRYPAHELPT